MPLFPYKTPSGTRYTLYYEMLQVPHLLIAGATGSGKSVVENALIYTALFQSPAKAQFIFIDPKRVELLAYKNLPHCILYATEPAEMTGALQAAMQITETRYKEMARRGVKKYNGGAVYVLIDEFADLMTTQKRAIMPIVQRLAQIGRAANIHIILCTQTPIAKVLPTEIKCNFDYRVALRTGNAQDSRNIIGVAGCELLPDPKTTGAGFAYYQTGADKLLYKIPMISDQEIKERVDFWERQKNPLHRMRNRLA